MIRLAAGTGHEGFSGDGGPAPVAQLHSPCSIALDGNGNLFIADSYNQRVRKVDSFGVISTVAGTGKFTRWNGMEPLGAYNGGSGPALKTDLSQPNGIALDRQGNLYLCDSWNFRIRKLTPQGYVSTVVGSGKSGFSGDGGPALRADLGFPFDVTFDAEGQMYIADSINHRIRKVDRKGIITTVAGDGKGGFSGDGGPAHRASLNLPNSITFDAHGSLFIADEANHRIRKVDRWGIITTVAGTGTAGFSGDGGPATRAQLHFPSGVEVDSRDNLFIADRTNHRIRWVHPDGTITLVAGNGGERLWRLFHGYGDDGPPDNASLAHPRHLAIDRDGTIYFADTGNDRIRKIEKVAAPGLFNGRPYPPRLARSAH